MFRIIYLSGIPLPTVSNPRRQKRRDYLIQLLTKKKGKL